MDTSLTDRLFSDPRLKLLAVEVGCAFKAVGILGWMWHGTQNVGVSVSDDRGILATFPAGVRGARKIIDALERTGWLEKCDQGYRIIGNDEHLKRREIVSNRGKAGAAARWGKKDAAGNEQAMQSAIAQASDEQCSQMPSSPLLSFPERVCAPAQAPARETTASPKPIETIADAKAARFTDAEGRELFAHWQAERIRLRPAVDLGIALFPPPAAVEHAKRVLALAGGMALAMDVVTRFIASDHPYWRDRQWALYLLANDRDFEQARNSPAPEAMRPEKTRAQVIAEERAARDAKYAREEAEALAEYERERAKGAM